MDLSASGQMGEDEATCHRLAIAVVVGSPLIICERASGTSISRSSTARDMR